MTLLSSIIARVESGSGADPALDQEICIALQYVPIAPWAINIRASEDSSVEYDVPERDPHWPNYGQRWCRLTSSVDAVEALRERMLPESGITTTQFSDSYYSLLFPNPNVSNPFFKGDAPTEARSRLAALLRAVEQGKSA